MATILQEVRDLAVALYRAEVAAYEGTGMVADERAALKSIAGPTLVLWKRRGGLELARSGQADTRDLFIMQALGTKFHKNAGVDPDMTWERALGLDEAPSGWGASVEPSTPAEPVPATTDEPDPGGDSE